MSAACGFAHQYKSLDAENLPLVLANYWHELDPDVIHAARQMLVVGIH